MSPNPHSKSSNLIDPSKVTYFDMSISSTVRHFMGSIVHQFVVLPVGLFVGPLFSPLFDPLFSPMFSPLFGPLFCPSTSLLLSSLLRRSVCMGCSWLTEWVRCLSLSEWSMDRGLVEDRRLVEDGRHPVPWDTWRTV